MPVCCLAARQTTYCPYRPTLDGPFRRARNGPSQMRKPALDTCTCSLLAYISTVDRGLIEIWYFQPDYLVRGRLIGSQNLLCLKSPMTCNLLYRTTHRQIVISSRIL